MGDCECNRHGGMTAIVGMRTVLEKHANYTGGVEQYLLDKLAAGRNPLLADLLVNETKYQFERPIREKYVLHKLDKYLETLSKEERLKIANQINSMPCDGASQSDIAKKAELVVPRETDTKEMDYNIYCVCAWRGDEEVHKQVCLEKTLESSK
jgi:hypothetical protein